MAVVKRVCGLTPASAAPSRSRILTLLQLALPITPSSVRLTITLTGRGERMRASGPVERGVRPDAHTRWRRVQPHHMRAAAGQKFTRRQSAYRAVVTGVVPEGPWPITSTTTSPSLAQTKCGWFEGSVKRLPTG